MSLGRMYKSTRKGGEGGGDVPLVWVPIKDGTSSLVDREGNQGRCFHRRASNSGCRIVNGVGKQVRERISRFGNDRTKTWLQPSTT